MGRPAPLRGNEEGLCEMAAGEPRRVNPTTEVIQPQKENLDPYGSGEAGAMVQVTGWDSDQSRGQQSDMLVVEWLI